MAEPMECKPFDTVFWRQVNCGYCPRLCHVPLEEAVTEIERLQAAIREVWPHLTGYCGEGATPECFGKMREILSNALPGLPAAHAERS